MLPSSLPLDTGPGFVRFEQYTRSTSGMALPQLGHIPPPVGAYQSALAPPPASAFNFNYAYAQTMHMRAQAPAMHNGTIPFNTASLHDPDRTFRVGNELVTPTNISSTSPFKYTMCGGVVHALVPSDYLQQLLNAYELFTTQSAQAQAQATSMHGNWNLHGPDPNVTLRAAYCNNWRADQISGQGDAGQANRALVDARPLISDVGNTLVAPNNSPAPTPNGATMSHCVRCHKKFDKGKNENGCTRAHKDISSREEQELGCCENCERCKTYKYTFTCCNKKFFLCGEEDWVYWADTQDEWCYNGAHADNIDEALSQEKKQGCYATSSGTKGGQLEPCSKEKGCPEQTTEINQGRMAKRVKRKSMPTKESQRKKIIKTIEIESGWKIS